jgi:hypothetical protein
MNSAPGVQDGTLEQWVDGEKLISMNQVPWIGTGGDMNKKWNILSIGGNDHHHTDLSGSPADREYWYAIDDVIVYNPVTSGSSLWATSPQDGRLPANYVIN